MKRSTGFGVRIDEHDQTLAAVAGSGQGTWTVTELSTAREGSTPPRALAQAMARQRQAVSWLMPNDLAKAAVFQLPLLKGKELTRAVEGWVAREEKGSAEDFSISWSPLALPMTGSDVPKHLIFALYAEKNDVNEHLGGSFAQSVKPARLIPGFMVLDQFFRLAHPAEKIAGAWNLVFLSKHENFLVISRDACPLLTRALPFDLSEGADSEHYVEQLATEVDRSGFYIKQGEHNPTIEKIIVAGDPELAGQLVKNLKSRMQVPIETWDIASHFKWGERKISSGSYIPLMAAALAEQKSVPNLLPEIKRSLFSPLVRRRALVAAATLAVALLPVMLVGGAITAKVQEGYLEKANRRLEIARLEAGDAAEIYKQQRLLLSRQNYIRSFYAERPDLESLLLQIGSLAPREIRFRDLRINEDDQGVTRLTVTGESEAATSSQAHQAFIQFQEALDRAEFLQAFTEPIKLEITGEAGGQEDQPRTVFRMKFLLITQQAEEG